MRIAPLVIPYVRQPSSNLWVDTILAAAVTHNDSASTASSVAFIALLWELLGYDGAPTPEWWLERFVAVARELETGRLYSPRGGQFQEDSGPLWQFVARRVGEAYRAELPVQDACNAWYSGAYLLETVPSLVYILMRHGHDPAGAIIAAVNDTRDNDTVAALVGAAVGALHGTAALPARWRVGLLGRLGADDDGQLAVLLEETRRIWFESGSQKTGRTAHAEGGPK
jgi:ADP-ribosylglycohydrolase